MKKLMFGTFLILSFIILQSSCCSPKEDNKNHTKITKTETKTEAKTEAKTDVELAKSRITDMISMSGSNMKYIKFFKIDGHDFMASTNEGTPVHLPSCEECAVEKVQYQINKQKVIREIIEKQKDILQDMLSYDDYNELVEQLKNSF